MNDEYNVDAMMYVYNILKGIEKYFIEKFHDSTSISSQLSSNYFAVNDCDVDLTNIYDIGELSSDLISLINQYPVLKKSVKKKIKDIDKYLFLLKNENNIGFLTPLGDHLGCRIRHFRSPEAKQLRYLRKKL